MNIINKQKIERAIFCAELLRGACLDGGDQLIREFFARDVEDLKRRVSSFGFMRDGLQEVCFPEAGRTINEERVVLFCRSLADSDRSRMREAVARADDERIESIVFIQSGGSLRFLLERGGRDCRRDGSGLGRLHNPVDDLNRATQDLFGRGQNQVLIMVLEPFSIVAVRNGQNERVLLGA